MGESYNTIKRLLKTEKGTDQEGMSKYFFEVDRRANKLEIKKAIEESFKVNVVNINTMNMHGKLRRVRYKWGKCPDWKKAVATLRAGEKIEIK